MVSANHNLEIEGTWEEILRRSNDLAGRRVRVTVLEKRQSNGIWEAAGQFLREVEQLQPEPRIANGKPQGNGQVGAALAAAETFCRSREPKPRPLAS